MNEAGHNGLVSWTKRKPEGWTVKRLKYAVRLISEKIDPGASDLRYIGLEHLQPWTGRLVEAMERGSADGLSTRFGPNDVLFGKLRPYLAKVYRAEKDGICSGELLVLRPTLLDSRYLNYFLLMNEFIAAVDASTYGSKMPRANWEFIGNLPALIPSLDEQRTIADFLDSETAAIDALIAKRTRFIELLNEERQALITHTVTKGLDPNVQMKDSREEWLREIPTQWRIVPSNRFFVESKQRAHEEDEHLSATQKYGVIPLAQFERLEGRQVTHAEKNLEQRKHVEVDNFVISMRSFQGGIERVKARGCVRSSYVALIADDRAHVGFFSYLFKSSAYIQGLQATAMFIRDGQDLNYNNFRQVKLPFPSFDEQRRIADFLDLEVSKNSALIAKTEEAISKLLEYRSALISAAVTGQIDVRNYRAQGVPSCP